MFSLSNKKNYLQIIVNTLFYLELCKLLCSGVAEMVFNQCMNLEGNTVTFDYTYLDDAHSRRQWAAKTQPVKCKYCKAHNPHHIGVYLCLLV